MLLGGSHTPSSSSFLEEQEQERESESEHAIDGRPKSALRARNQFGGKYDGIYSLAAGKSGPTPIGIN